MLTALACIGTAVALYPVLRRHGPARAVGFVASRTLEAAVKDWTFLLGPGVMPAVNALLFATIVYRARLAPRWIPALGLIGAPLLVVSSTATLFGVWEQVSSASMLMALPIATWEFSVGVHMTVKGLRTPRMTERDATPGPAAPPALAPA